MRFNSKPNLLLANSNVNFHNSHAVRVLTFLDKNPQKQYYIITMKESEIKTNFSQNLVALRKSRKLTQAELAVKLNYSDKSISKWERGDVLPDIVTFKMIAEFFGVTVDELISGDKPKQVSKRGKRILITLLSCALVFFVATVGGLFYTSFSSFKHLWLFYVYATPVASIVWLVFANIWFSRWVRLISVSSLVWTAGASAYLSVLVFASRHVWFLFIVCATFQVLVFMWFALFNKIAKEKSETPSKIQ